MYIQFKRACPFQTTLSNRQSFFEGLSRPEIGLHKNVNLWKLENTKTKKEL
jgi:hypothetical protein